MAKKIETMEDALIVAYARATCYRTACGDCAVYKRGYNGDCQKLQNEVKDFFKKTGINNEDDFIKAVCGDLPDSEDKPKREGTCKDCANHKKLEGGYLFCDKWHNTTAAEGHCHLFTVEGGAGNG